MKTQSRKQILGYTAFALLAGIVLGIARAVISTVSLERGIEMYAHGSIAPAILHALVAICAILLFTAAFRPLHDNRAADDPESVSQLTVFASTFSGFIILAHDLYLIFEAAQDNWSAIGPLIGRAPTASVTLASAVFTLCLMILAIPAAIYFFKVAQGTHKPSTPIFSTCAIVWFVLLALHIYFDTVTAFNSPTKIFRILAVLALVMHAIHETRRMLGIPMPRLYFPAAYIAILLGITHAVSDAVLYAQGRIVLAEGYIGIAVELAYVVYILSRLLYLGTTKVRIPAAEPAATEALQENRTQN